MTKDADEQKRPAQVSDDNDVTKRIKKRQVKIRFIQTYHFVQFEIQHLNQMWSIRMLILILILILIPKTMIPVYVIPFQCVSFGSMFDSIDNRQSIGVNDIQLALLLTLHHIIIVHHSQSQRIFT